MKKYKEDEIENTQSFSFEKEEKKFVKIPDEVKQSGFCDKCRNYYDDTPVINGVVICPHCEKNK
jgi:hypothetical protein